MPALKGRKDGLTLEPQERGKAGFEGAGLWSRPKVSPLTSKDSYFKASWAQRPYYIRLGSLGHVGSCASSPNPPRPPPHPKTSFTSETSTILGATSTMVVYLEPLGQGRL